MSTVRKNQNTGGGSGFGRNRVNFFNIRGKRNIGADVGVHL